MSVDAGRPDLRIVGGWGDLPEEPGFILADLLASSKEEDWRFRASCAEVGSNAWFPEVGENPSEAKRVCMTCEVKAECLQYALDNDERSGVWGGLSERERRKLKKTGKMPVPTARKRVKAVRDAEITRLRSVGYSTAETAVRMGIDPRTVTRVAAMSRRQRREKEAA